MWSAQLSPSSLSCQISDTSFLAVYDVKFAIGRDRVKSVLVVRQLFKVGRGITTEITQPIHWAFAIAQQVILVLTMAIMQTVPAMENHGDEHDCSLRCELELETCLRHCHPSGPEEEHVHGCEDDCFKAALVCCPSLRR